MKKILLLVSVVVCFSTARAVDFAALGLPVRTETESVNEYLQQLTPAQQATYSTAVEDVHTEKWTTSFIHCESIGGTVVERTTPENNVFGVCQLPGGEECDLWALLEGACSITVFSTPVDAVDLFPATENFDDMAPKFDEFKIKKTEWETETSVEKEVEKTKYEQKKKKNEKKAKARKKKKLDAVLAKREAEMKKQVSAAAEKKKKEDAAMAKKAKKEKKKQAAAAAAAKKKADAAAAKAAKKAAAEKEKQDKIKERAKKASEAAAAAAKKKADKAAAKASKNKKKGKWGFGKWIFGGTEQ